MSSAATISEAETEPNAQFAQLRAARAVAVNHLGYEIASPKHAVLCLGEGAPFVEARLRDAETGQPVFTRAPGKPGRVAQWRGQRYQAFDFTEFDRAGSFVLEAVDADGRVVSSAPFEIMARLYALQTMPLIADYFRSQRCRDAFDEQDRAIPFVGTKRNARADVRGGWYDASGDVSKYLSHLSYANFMNPQQIPLVVWALATAAAAASTSPDLKVRFAAEAAWGADFLVRMFDPQGMFYMTVFDRWTGDLEEREICSYSTQQGHKHDSWEAGFRQGGGMAIAALAKMARLGFEGEFDAARYAEVAAAAFAHLQHHNTDYLDNGAENIIDDYCALMAAVELRRLTGNGAYDASARLRADNLISRLTQGEGQDGWWRADDAGRRPFTHAADEGLPILALTEYLDIADEQVADRVRSALDRAVSYLGWITGGVFNPFAYPRHAARNGKRGISTQFFFPHENESGYWWQGENARLGSLAYALRRAAPHLGEEAAHVAANLPQRWLDWILGLNPFHSCMMQGVGRNWADYTIAKFPNADGGICNGITSSMHDEDDVAFCESENPFQSWRWSEQWLPHSAWFLLAMTTY